MGYQIQYGAVMVKKHIPERKKLSVSQKISGILFVVLFIFLAIIFGSREGVQDFLIPGNSRVTREAMSKMVTDLREGEPLSDSFEAFCREIVSSAGIQK